MCEYAAKKENKSSSGSVRLCSRFCEHSRIAWGFRLTFDEFRILSAHSHATHEADKICLALPKMKTNFVSTKFSFHKNLSCSEAGRRCFWSLVVFVPPCCDFALTSFEITCEEKLCGVGSKKMATSDLWFGYMFVSLGFVKCFFERSYHLQTHTQVAVDPH